MSYKTTNQVMILSFFGICFAFGWFIYNGISSMKPATCPEQQVIITECKDPEIIYQEPDIEYYPEYIEKEVEVEKIVEVIDENCQIELNTIKEELSAYHRELCIADPENVLCKL